MEAWNDMINTALLGTEKMPLPAQAGIGALQQAMAQINSQAGLDKEEQFLQLAAVTFNVRQSGTKPLHQPTPNWIQAAAESLPYCSTRAAQVLKDLLEDEYQPLVNLWLERCIAAKRIVIPELVPTLLNRAIQHKEIRPSVATVCGCRGQWLSRFNPAWEFTNTTGEEELWHTGNLDQRKAALKRMREKDPAKARQWLEGSWPQDNANARAEFLKQLDGAVQPEDEPFLVGALNEKSQKVKDAAIVLLQQSPDSILVRNYAETAGRQITIKKEKALLGLSTKTTLHIQPAPVPEKAAWLSGIDYLSPNKNYKDEEYVLYQLIQHTPPAFWEQHFALSPVQILEYFTGPHEKYFSAFAKAAGQFKAVDWAKAILLVQGEGQFGQYTPLLQLLPLPEQEARIIRSLHKHENSEAQLQKAMRWPENWSHELAKEVINYTAKQPYKWTLHFYKDQITRIPVSIVPQLKNFAPAEPAHAQMWATLADQLTHLLRLKESTQNAFNE
ncbi:MAG TPA: DUF5691 domain-containing protein [Puia sp.]|uniref:DUF5691 domain-containing protein n=1 Tax=Puia sp. TaxID=2045100 RepID=UPI002BC9068B|nr:DUF5691 domain-containing protein [Puia sp.]HVU95309.1 DUF5691 domain-containing protein [Puia sp.]